LSARLVLACLLMGFTALVAQVTLTRELLALFYGNELSIALVLAVWLVAVAAGSAAGARVAPRLQLSERAFGWSQLAMAVLLPLSLLTSRHVQVGSLAPGQVLGPGATLLASLETLAPVCLAAGLQFVLAASAAAARRHKGSADTSAVALVYALEGAGAVVGGIAYHWWFAEYAMPLATLALAGLLNVASAAALLRLRLPFVGLPIAVGSALAVLAIGADRAELASLRASPRWSHLNPVAFASSRHGPLVLTRRAGQLSLSQSGVLLFTSQDEYANEVAVHLPLLEHPEPRRLLIIGGSIAGLAGEALRHPIIRLDCIELDPRVVELARRWLPASLLRPLDDPRLHLSTGDGRLFVRRARERYDVIIVNLPDPTTAALNRFYTAEFMREAKRALSPSGLLAFGLTGSETQPRGGLRLAAATMDHTMASLFADHLIVPGERMLFLASQRRGLLSRDWRLLAGRLAHRGVRTSFVNDAWLRDALLPFRAELVQRAIGEVRRPRLNTDLNPVSYYYQLRIWLDQLSPKLARAARWLAQRSVWWLMVPFALAALVLLLTRGQGRKAVAVLISTAAMGGFGLVAEVLVLLVFQSACGYLYHALAGLTAAFMGGLALGAAVMRTRTASHPVLARLVLAVLVTAVCVCVLLPAIARAVTHTPSAAPLALGLLLLFAGSLVGATFPVMTALYRRERGAAAAGGAVYAADLVGSAGAGLVTGAVAVPLLGLAGVAFAAALCLGAALVLALPLLRSS